MIPSVYHPTDRPNFYVVRTDRGNFWYSYETCVAFVDERGHLFICENVWSKTTGKHLNMIDDNRKKRIPYHEFQQRLADVVNPPVMAEML